MLFGKIKGVNKKISKIILGNDSQRNYSKAAKLWDHYYNKKSFRANIIDCIKNKKYYISIRIERRGSSVG